jgi:hypothetical protein
MREMISTRFRDRSGEPVMLNQVQSVSLGNKVQAFSSTTIEPAFGRLLSRLVQVGVALYLLPLFLAIAAASAAGILFLAVTEPFTRNVRREASVPKERAGLEIFRG